ncbi:hypothetical protein Cri9333_1751 [Crinalium epipsammum PCC 9333]|uniref:DUF948 domain-containing protein n=1 Tax=Crinalium epipsammum PCC 9333 TaxID=1173022 RepID=K9VXF2_9CYAN|nr:DUF948 domain-containing protein [Crinalium epipsammum]AFZ12636.1 hypothetical protein Cri9333_1751 [Crinalium epipsammum PCC 9333]
MIDPLFWLGLSILLVAVSLTAVLVTALPALQELARAARSAEKLFDTLRRELPPTLESIRLTGMEITELTDEVNEGVKSATQVVKQVDQSVSGAKKQAQNLQTTTRSVITGVKAAWKALKRPNTGRKSDRLPQSQKNTFDLRRGGTTLPDTQTARASDRDETKTKLNRKAFSSDPNDVSPYLRNHEDLQPLDSEDYLVNPTTKDEADEETAP